MFVIVSGVSSASVIVFTVVSSVVSNSVSVIVSVPVVPPVVIILLVVSSIKDIVGVSSRLVASAETNSVALLSITLVD